jgi:hypothetical protein
LMMPATRSCAAIGDIDMPSNSMKDATTIAAAIEIALRMSAPVRVVRCPVDITKAVARWTLSLRKAFVKDVKCLILQDLAAFAAC